MNLNTKQEQAVELVNKHDITYIKGSAGTGKTYTSKVILEQFSSKHIVAVAPSHKAKSVLMQSLEDLCEVTTVSSYLGKRPIKGKFIKMKESMTCDILLVDEASMLSEEDFNQLKVTASKVILLGDSKQLPPVNSTQADLSSIPSIELTEQMRQQDTSSSMYKAIQAFTEGKGLKDIQEDSSFKKVDTESELMLAYAECESANKVIIAYDNPQVDSYNFALQEQLHHRDRYQVDDKLILQKPATVNKRPVMNNGELVTLLSIDGSKGIISNGKNQVEVNLKPDMVKHTYAMTAHKTQGSTYDHIFIDVNNIAKAKDLQLLKLLYVAFSRATTSLTMLRKH